MTHADTFARFIGVLAETLDAPTAYAERLHLSRFHVDRIVSRRHRGTLTQPRLSSRALSYCMPGTETHA